MPDSFDFTEDTRPEGTTVLRITGHLDARSTPGLVDRCRFLRKQGRNVVINLGKVSFIASSGVGGLLTLIEDFKGHDLAVRLVDPSPAVQSVIKLLNLDKFLVIDRTEAAAIAALET
jgi:anti-anti-sigma factor